MLSSGTNSFVGREEILGALNAVVSGNKTASKKSAENGQDVLVEYYTKAIAPDHGKLRNSAKVREVVMSEWLRCLEENHITPEILDAMCRYSKHDSAVGQSFVSCCKLWYPSA